MARVANTRIVAYRGFTIDATNMTPVVVTRGWDGVLVLKQNEKIITIPPNAIPLFQRAVADLKEIP